MNINDAVQSIIKPHEDDHLTPLTTIWGEALDVQHPLPEYPRPQMQRDSFISLNGYWDYAITGTMTFPSSYDGKILVPFSPECQLSGVQRQLQPEEFLWYRTTLPEWKGDSAEEQRLLLHFDAVDYLAEVYVNGQFVISHQGGYLPFSADITDFLKEDSNELLLRVQDQTDSQDQARGKQTLHRGGIFYTAQSGIWQSVWLEQVPASHIENLRFETDYDACRVTAHINACCQKDLGTLGIRVFCAGQEIAAQSLTIKAAPASREAPFRRITASLSFTIGKEWFRSWSPEEPFLYDVEVTFDNDRVKSYFALRCYSIEKPAGKPVFCLNHKPYFLMGVLDQGYWPDGLYTAPSDEALLYDIRSMKELGFNMLRKHIKVESARWYYHCDRLGMIVCQDMVNGGSSYHMPVISYFPTLLPSLSSRFKDTRHYSLLSRKDEKARQAWEKECRETVKYLSFFPSIAIWVPFNEGWGQFDSERITNMIRTLDPSRLIDSASGWFDQGCGDFISEHNYFRPLAVPTKKWGNRAYFLSEYGGFACHLKGHTSVDRVFGYKRFDTLEEFKTAYHELIEKSLLPLQKQGLSGAVYTQLSDVEEEVNGILTYDRKVNKLLS